MGALAVAAERRPDYEHAHADRRVGGPALSAVGSADTGPSGVPSALPSAVPSTAPAAVPAAAPAGVPSAVSGRAGSGSLGELRDHLGRLADEQLDALDARAQADRLEELNELRNLLDAEIVRCVEHFDTSEAYEPAGAASPTAWLRGVARLGHGEARDHTTVARRLRHLPATAAALSAGEIGLRHAKVIARAATDERLAAIRDVEDHLVDAARRMHPGLLERLVREIRNAVDHRRAADDANDVRAGRYAFVSSTIDGMVAVNALLDAEGGALLSAAIDALMAPDPTELPAEERRTPAQRRADALVEIARQVLDADTLPDCAGRRPHLTLTVGLEMLEARAAEAGDDGLIDWSALRARLASGEPITAATARRIACDAHLSPLILSRDGQILHLGRSQRTTSVPLRRALDARDQGCRGPHCDAPIRWCQAHHVVFWNDGGPTDPTNLLLLCWRCHRRVHEGGWLLEMTDDAAATFTDPWGRSYVTRPRGRPAR